MGRYMRYTIDIVKEIARERGGECLSVQYVNTKSDLVFRCFKKQHVFESPLDYILHNEYFCPECWRENRGATRMHSIDYMHELAAKHEGSFLSPEYLGLKKKHLWSCKQNHIFSMRAGDVVNGHWCSFCAKVAKGSIEEMQLIAQLRGGRCLSTEYINSKENLEFECKNGHKWKATPGNIKGSKNKVGSWCADCNCNITQELCRYIIEKLTGKSFRITRAVLDGKLELDGYCEELKVAFEYNGGQHQEYNKFFHQNNVDNFEAQKKRDAEKISLCNKNGITLVVIPNAKEFGYSDLVGTIYTKLTEGGITPIINASAVSLDEFYRTTSTLDEVKSVMASKGGTLLSVSSKGGRTLLEVQCAQGHIWSALLSTIKKHWCKKCADAASGKNKRLTLEYLQEIAKSRGGKCLATEYDGNNEKLPWQCKFGHVWSATPNSILSKRSWCKICNINRLKESARKKRLTIEYMREVAAEKGGLCLSKEYVNCETKLDWQCREGHQFAMRPSDVLSKKKHWCPECSGRKKKTIKDMHAFAESKGGKCLSTEYLGNKKPLKWECLFGHRFERSYNQVSRASSWCPHCKGK